MAPPKSRQSKLLESSIAFDYVKSSQFRSVHADGLIGGVTPNGHVHVAFFSERPAIPRRIVQAIGPDGSLGEELLDQRESRNSIVREMDVDIFLAPDVARSMYKWLGERLNELEQRETLLKAKSDD